MNERRKCVEAQVRLVMFNMEVDERGTIVLEGRRRRAIGSDRRVIRCKSWSVTAVGGAWSRDQQSIVVTRKK
jgi:hypothetical protein